MVRKLELIKISLCLMLHINCGRKKIFINLLYKDFSSLLCYPPKISIYKIHPPKLFSHEINHIDS